MENTSVLTKAYQIWILFEEWSLANSKQFTDYERTMFQWMAIFSVCQNEKDYAELASDEVHSFVNQILYGKGDE